jgi:hypothetical protein
MAVTLIKAYQGFAAGATLTFPVELEASLVAQGFAAYAAVGGVNTAVVPPLSGAITAGTYGPAVLSNIPMGNAALTGYESNGVAHTAWATNVTEIFVPHWNTWTGASMLNGTGVGTDTQVYFLFNSNGYLIQYTTIAGTTNSTASVFQKIAFNVPVTLAPGRYFLGAQISGTTVTPRHVLTANGAEPRCAAIATITSHAAALATFTAAPITVPTTFTTALAPIMQLYS